MLIEILSLGSPEFSNTAVNFPEIILLSKSYLVIMQVPEFSNDL
jgi:hypothetical protein